MITNLLAWSVLLISQNISFTYVSRARNSGSLTRHIKAAIFSNGIWIVSNMVMLGPMLDQLTGKKGLPLQIVSGLVYTVACVTGGILAHYWALRTEKGKSAVGANKKYAQIPVEEWAVVSKAAAEFVAYKQQFGPEFMARVEGLANDAYSITVGMVPDSQIVAHKNASPGGNPALTAMLQKRG
jgi:hypothetical protein